MEHQANRTIVQAAVAAAADRQRGLSHLWTRTAEERVQAFYEGKLTLRECLAWAARFPNEVPRSADGEFLFISVATPEWADHDPPGR